MRHAIVKLRNQLSDRERTIVEIYQVILKHERIGPGLHPAEADRVRDDRHHSESKRVASQAEALCEVHRVSVLGHDPRFEELDVPEVDGHKDEE